MKTIKISKFDSKKYEYDLAWQCGVILKQDYGVESMDKIPPEMIGDIGYLITSPDTFYKRTAEKIKEKAMQIIKKEDYTEEKEYELLNVQLVDGKLSFIILNNGIAEVKNDLQQENYKII